MSRLGEYSVDGGIAISFGTSEANYLFDSTARTAVGNADFVLIGCGVGTTAASVRFDTQGDGGSGTLIAAGTGTGTAKNVSWSLQVGRLLFLPASLFGTTDTLRTGRGISSTASTTVTFVFCSWV